MAFLKRQPAAWFFCATL